MRDDPGHEPDDHEIRAALQHALRDRFDGVAWAALHDRIVADGLARSTGARGPSEVLAAWSPRAAMAAGSLIAAGVLALLLISDGAEADTVPPGFWPVAEELLAGVPEDARRLINAGTQPEELLALIVADAREEVNRR
jgi:hypothetical protein